MSLINCHFLTNSLDLVSRKRFLFVLYACHCLQKLQIHLLKYEKHKEKHYTIVKTGMMIGMTKIFSKLKNALICYPENHKNKVTIFTNHSIIPQSVL